MSGNYTTETKASEEEEETIIYARGAVDLSWEPFDTSQ